MGHAYDEYSVLAEKPGMTLRLSLRIALAQV
jgi:hypothetical protein